LNKQADGQQKSAAARDKEDNVLNDDFLMYQFYYELTKLLSE
jgi:hypothetical protein